MSTMEMQDQKKMTETLEALKKLISGLIKQVKKGDIQLKEINSNMTRSMDVSPTCCQDDTRRFEPGNEYYLHLEFETLKRKYYTRTGGKKKK